MTDDVRSLTGIEAYVNDEVDDPNPGIIVDSSANRGRALTSEQARMLARDLLNMADYFDGIEQELVHTHVTHGHVEGCPACRQVQQTFGPVMGAVMHLPWSRASWVRAACGTTRHGNHVTLDFDEVTCRKCRGTLKWTNRETWYAR